MPINYDAYSPILDKTGKSIRIRYLAKQDTFGVCQIKVMRSENMILVKNLMDDIAYWTIASELTMIPEDEAIILMLKQKY